MKTEPPPYINDPDAIVTAAYHGEYENVLRLIQQGADFNARDGEGNTGIIAAADHGYFGVIEVQANAGADVNATNADGNSALDLARYGHHRKAVELLIKLGAQGRDGPSAKERREDAMYESFEQTNDVKLAKRQLQNG